MMEAQLPSEIRQQFEHLTQQLVEEFQDRFTPETITRHASDQLHRYHDARILTFVPTLVYRHTREELKRQVA
jgi:hypothetical protein